MTKKVYQQNAQIFFSVLFFSVIVILKDIDGI